MALEFSDSLRSEPAAAPLPKPLPPVSLVLDESGLGALAPGHAAAAVAPVAVTLFLDEVSQPAAAVPDQAAAPAPAPHQRGQAPAAPSKPAPIPEDLLREASLALRRARGQEPAPPAAPTAAAAADDDVPAILKALAGAGADLPAPAPVVAAPQAAQPSGDAPAPPSEERQDAKGGGGGGGRIGDRLVEMGLLSKDQLQVALYEKKRSKKLLGNLLVELGFITESALSAVLVSSSGLERFDLKDTVVEPDLLKAFPKEVAQRYRVLPVSLDGNQLRLAMADIYDVLALDQARRYLPMGCEIIPLVSSENDIVAAIDQYYGYELSIDGILRELETGDHDVSTAALSGDAGYVHPLVRLVNAMLLDAVKCGASDIHFEPEGNFMRLRYRVDGVMTQIRTFHKDHWPAISHRLKIVSGMNIADKLNPQDGRFGFTIGQRRVDFRVACLPTVHGENIVIRILDKSGALLSIESLGFSEGNLALLQRLLKRPEGIVLVTGPTGSGKTTTLYGVLNHISSLERNIMTLEDPVEYELPLIRQSQVREGTGVSFADGVRALLRQDPDVIFIGEVRDRDTAVMALRAAMTGHQVFSTLHTNDAAGAIPRLHDLGLDHGLLAGNIIGVVAQRLARRLCSCAGKRPATDEECRIFGVDPKDPPQIGQPVGCETCRYTGYKGRIAVHEILPMNTELDELVLRGAPLSQVRDAARRYGFRTMAEDGIGKVLAGVLSLDSLMRTVDLSGRL
ncbi:putative type II secretion system protein E [mine drainage metagenome]|uniref:Putative type II secretion system protein E n=1 Tax=mine drainage metagenome TaxID=410659 RepID=A0A1J5R0Y2_9ZZZZ